MKKIMFLLMTKKVFLAALLISAAGVISSYAQCTPDISCIPNGTDYGICPDSATGLAIGIVGVPYSQSLSIKTPTTAAHWGTPSANIDSLVVTSVDSLAPGLTYVCVPSRRFTPGSGCIYISGTPTQVWNHTITVHITPYVYYFVHMGTTPTTNKQYRSIIVAPAPTLTSSLTQTPICSGNSFSYTPTSGTTSTTFAWSRALITGINNPAANGTGNPGETLINTTASPITVTYVYTLSASGTATSSGYNVTVTVNPKPTLTSSLNPPSICSDSVFHYTPTSLTTGATFAWARATVNGISNAAGSGSANISETLINTTNSPVNVTYIYTVAANGCTNSTTYSVTIAVTTCNCVQSLSSSLTPAPICSGATFNYTPTSAASGTTFSWARAAVTGISNTAATGTGNPNEVLINTSANPVNVAYIYSLTLSGCTNTYSVAVTVNPVPALNSSLSPTSICSGTVLSYTPASTTSGATFAWTRAVVNGISNTAGGGTGNINETLNNTAANTAAVTYVYTTSANNCTNPATSNVVVNVYPQATLSSSLSPASICSGHAFTYTAIGSVSGATLSWARAAVTGISNAAGSGTGNINETLTNTTTNSINVTYVYTVSANSCINPTTFSVVVPVGTCTGIEENSILQNVTIYPNPANDELNFSVNEVVIGYRYTLTDFVGRAVQQGLIDKTIMKLSLSGLTQGMYFLTIEGKTKKTFKVLKN